MVKYQQNHLVPWQERCHMGGHMLALDLRKDRRLPPGAQERRLSDRRGYARHI
jgi:hypothetical protein